MKLSIVVIMHNMQREAARTLYSLSTAHQVGVDPDAYEVIVIDNGSSAPLTEADVTRFGPQFHYHFHKTTSVSPVEAINLGAQLAQGDALALIVDGARMATPRLIKHTLSAFKLEQDPVVSALSWHLGPDIQPKSTQNGYNQAVEDKMLDAACWRGDGYRLFEISTIAPSSEGGFFGPFPPECSWVALRRATFHEIGGFDVRFQTPGGGFCNHEFRNRAVTREGVVPAIILGEGVFHQVHGGIATNAPPTRRPLELFYDEYNQIFGKRYRRVDVTGVLYLGGHVRGHDVALAVSGGQERVIAVGGMPGQKTAVIAKMLQHAGVHMGGALTPGLDNEWFAFLFGQFARSQLQPDMLGRAIRIFRRAMKYGIEGALTESDRAFLESLTQSVGTGAVGSAESLVEGLIQSGPSPVANGGGWGWKGPLTHRVLPFLDRILPEFRYIHVVPDGIETALGQRKPPMCDLQEQGDVATVSKVTAEAGALRQWLSSHRATVDYGRQHMPGRFLAIPYSSFCANPEPFWFRIRALAGANSTIEIPETLIQEISKTPKPSSDLSVFPEGLLKKVREFEMELEKSAEMG